VLLLVACGGGPPLPAPLPVVGGGPPSLFVESAVVGPPGADGSRFGREWTLGTDARGRRLATSPEKGGAIEVGNVDFLPRTLVLEVGDVAPERKLHVSFDRRPLATVPLAGRLAVPLPRDLPIGRYRLDLASDPPAAIPLLAAHLEPSLPAGTLTVSGRDVEQSGSALAYFDRRLPRDEAILVGTFVPPASPRPGQRFELVLEREDGTPIRRFDWSPSFWNRVRGARDIELPMGDAQGLVHARLRALGEGPPARWHDLRYSWTANRPGIMSGPAPAAPSPPKTNLPRGGRP